jgi:hypothetical protein
MKSNKLFSYNYVHVVLVASGNLAFNLIILKGQCHDWLILGFFHESVFRLPVTIKFAYFSRDDTVS